MLNNDFEKAFGDFLDRPEYDHAEAALFDIVRFAFLSGWKAAGGDPPQPQKVFTLLPPKEENPDIPPDDK